MHILFFPNCILIIDYGFHNESLMNIYFPIILVTAASNESDNVAKSFLQLKLCLENDGKVKNVFTEMTIGQFYKFLHDLEKAKCNLDLLL